MTNDRSRRRTTTWNLFFHYANIALAMVSGVVLVPLYLRFIPLDLYGAWLGTGNILAWLTVIDPGLSTVLQQRTAVAYGKGDSDELSGLLTGGAVLSGVVSLLVMVGGLVSSRFVIGWLQLGATPNIQVVADAFALAAVGTGLMMFSYSATTFNQGLQGSVGIGVVFVVTMVGSLVVTVVLLYRGVGLLALPIGLIVRGAGLTIGNGGYVAWRFVDEKMRYRCSFEGIWTLAKLSSYTFLGRAAGVIATNMDAFVLTRYLGPDVATVFVMTRKAPDLSRMFVERPAVAFMPAVSSLVGAGEAVRARGILLRLVRMTVWLLGAIGGGFVVFNRAFVGLWLGPKFFAGGGVNVLFALALVVTVVIGVLSNLCFALGNIRGNGAAALLQGAISIPLAVVGTRYWGMIGMALAPLVAMGAVSAWYYPLVFSHLLKLEGPDRREIGREAAAVVVATIVAMAALFWVAATTWAAFALAVVGFGMVYLAVLSGLSQALRKEIVALL